MSKTCGGTCSGTCGPSGGCCGKHEHEPRIGEDLPRLPYNSLYVKCVCGEVGFTPEIWAEFGPEIINAKGSHSRTSCTVRDACGPTEAALCRIAAGR